MEFSDKLKIFLIECKALAIRLENPFIGQEHILFCMDRVIKENRIPYFRIKIPFSTKKKIVIFLKSKSTKSIKNENPLLTIKANALIKFAMFHCEVLKHKELSPLHLYLALFLDMGYIKEDEYFDFLKLANISPSYFHNKQLRKFFSND